MENGMEKEKNTIIMVNWYLMVNIQMEKDGMEKEHNIMVMVNFYLKLYIEMEKLYLRFHFSKIIDY